MKILLVHFVLNWSQLIIYSLIAIMKKFWIFLIASFFNLIYLSLLSISELWDSTELLMGNTRVLALSVIVVFCWVRWSDHAV
jgi:hypothetical protein